MAGGTIYLFTPSAATASQTCPEENDLISLLHFPNLQNRANFAYLRGAGKGLMLAKELKLAQMQDATDAQNDDSRPSLQSIVLQSLLTAPVKAWADKIGSMAPSRVSCDISALLPPQKHGISAPVSGYAASAVISHDLLHVPCHTRNSFLGSLPGCSAGRTPS